MKEAVAEIEQTLSVFIAVADCMVTVTVPVKSVLINQVYHGMKAFSVPTVSVI